MSLQSFNARTGQAVGAALAESSATEIDAAVQAADQAFTAWSSSTGSERAALLRALASGLEAQREQLVPLADEETALGPIRLNGELDRTAFQLRRFADIAERGQPFVFTDDPAVAGAPPAGIGAGGGMLRRLLPVFTLGLGGALGSGNQYLSWISLPDVVQVILRLLCDREMSGVYNLTGPRPVTRARSMSAASPPGEAAGW